MRIGLDIDGVLCNFAQGIIDKAKELGYGDLFPPNYSLVKHWFIANDNSEQSFLKVWKAIKKDYEFWLKLKPLPYCSPLHFIPDCYITSRPVESFVTKHWLKINKFPIAPVITTNTPFEKLDYVKDLDVFIDDHWLTVAYLRQNGINAVLYEAPYQRGHDITGLPKISSLREVTSMKCPHCLTPLEAYTLDLWQCPFDFKVFDAIELPIHIPTDEPDITLAELACSSRSCD